MSDCSIPARDYAGVETALFELMEESLGRSAQEALKRRLKEGATDNVLAAYDVRRSLPEGYYLWGAHILMVDAAVTAGLILRAHHLLSDEALGLSALRSARNKFAAAHPPCPHCGHPLIDPGNACALCGKAKS